MSYSLRTCALAVAESADDRTWPAALLGTTEPALAVTGQGGAIGRVPRDWAWSTTTGGTTWSFPGGQHADPVPGRADGRHVERGHRPPGHVPQPRGRRVPGWGWPAQLSDVRGHLNGTTAEVALYRYPLGLPAVREHLAVRAAASLINQVTLPSGKTYMQAAYNMALERVSQLTDATHECPVAQYGAACCRKRCQDSVEEPFSGARQGRRCSRYRCIDPPTPTFGIPGWWSRQRAAPLAGRPPRCRACRTAPCVARCQRW